MITPAHDSDMPDIARMLFDLNALHAVHRPDRFHTDGSPPDICAFLRAQTAQGAQILVYRTNGVARGYVLWLPMSPEPTALTKARRTALLDHIFVEPIWRRRGLGARLLARFLADSRAQGFVHWQARVHSFNAASAALMEKYGAERRAAVYEGQLL